jgi:hypothetical protein
MKTVLWYLVFAGALVAIAYFGLRYVNQPGQCIKNAYGQCTTGEFSP